MNKQGPPLEKGSDTGWGMEGSKLSVQFTVCVSGFNFFIGTLYDNYYIIWMTREETSGSEERIKKGANIELNSILNFSVFFIVLLFLKPSLLKTNVDSTLVNSLLKN